MTVFVKETVRPRGELRPDGVAGGHDARRGTSSRAAAVPRVGELALLGHLHGARSRLGGRQREQDAAADRGHQGDGAGDQRDLAGERPDRARRRRGAARAAAASAAAPCRARGRRAEGAERGERAPRHDEGGRASVSAASALPPCGMRRKSLPRTSSSDGWSSSSQSLLSPWITKRSPSMATIRCMTTVFSETLR